MYHKQKTAWCLASKEAESRGFEIFYSKSNSTTMQGLKSHPTPITAIRAQTKDLDTFAIQEVRSRIQYTLGVVTYTKFATFHEEITVSTTDREQSDTGVRVIAFSRCFFGQFMKARRHAKALFNTKPSSSTCANTPHRILPRLPHSNRLEGCTKRPGQLTWTTCLIARRGITWSTWRFSVLRI